MIYADDVASPVAQMQRVCAHFFTAIHLFTQIIKAKSWGSSVIVILTGTF